MGWGGMAPSGRGEGTKVTGEMGSATGYCGEITLHTMHAAWVILSTEQVMHSDVGSLGAPSALLRMTSVLNIRAEHLCGGAMTALSAASETFSGQLWSNK
jgi:hypothetical protein